tara:strand:- start:429173 stop:429799 length:627 start_codon:yes stop_codon:yes gene_type:complete
VRNLFLSASLVATAFVAGCASTPSAPEGAQPADIRQEAAAVTKHLDCNWLQLPDPMYPSKGNDFACVADNFASVILFVEPAKEFASSGAPKVQKIKLVWKEWRDNVNLTDTKRDASRFIAFITQRYFPQEDAMPLVDMFFDMHDRNYTSGKLSVKYTYRRQPALNLHRMEIINEDPELNLYTYPAPHEIPAPAMAPTNSTTSTTSNGE